MRRRAPDLPASGTAKSPARRDTSSRGSSAVKAASDRNHSRIHRQDPVVDIAGLRRDIYRLLVLLLADDKVVEVDAFSELADDYHEGEVNRLLIWITIA